jgi:hypothetical protein
MQWVNPANWGEDDQEEMEEAEMSSIQAIVEHFSVPLAERNYSATPSKLRAEWRKAKKLFNQFYKSLKAQTFWKRVLQQRCENCPNICLLVECIFAIGASNSVVESCFSILTSTMSDRRLCLGHDTLENLLLIKCNDKMLNDSERAAIIDSAVKKFLSKKRKTLQDADDDANEEPSRKRQRQEEESDDECVILGEELDEDEEDEDDDDDDEVMDEDDAMNDLLF